MTKPFICRGDDGAVYFVKGADAGRRSLLCEWIAGNLCLHLGLPIAPFEIVHVPEALLAFDTGELRDLGAGPAFGSRERQITELTFAAIMDNIRESLQQDVLLFDWWVRNGDRMLSEVGGNPNLFLEPGTGELIVIDHNQAFDDSLEKNDFLESHVFGAQAGHVFGDSAGRSAYNARLAAALEHWPDIRAGIPEDWLFLDPEMTVSVDFDLDRVYELLKEHERDEFWACP